VEIRPYEPGDETAIVELYRQTFDPSFSQADWTWWYQENPLGDQLVQLAWAGNTLAAHYAVCPVEMIVDGRTVKTALSLHTMTHPAFRGRGLFPRLAETLYARMATAEYAMVWGFPNEMSHRGFIQRLQWKDVCEIPMMQLRIDGFRKELHESPCVEHVKEFDERFDRLWELVAEGMVLARCRKRDHLNWRFQRHPRNRYSVLAFVRSNEVLGYIVTKRFQDGLDLVDFLAVDDREVTSALLHHAILTARRQDLSCISTWFPLRHPIHHVLEKLGFENLGPSTYLGCRWLSGSGFKVDVEDAKNWYYTMADSDVF